MAAVPPWFADYYRKASISPQRDWLELRWKGIEAFLAKGPPSTDLILLHFGLTLPKPSLVESLQQAFYQNDPTFPVQSTPSHELRVLAACAITQTLETGQPSKKTDALALGVQCTAAQGARETIVPSLVVSAATYLQRRAIELRDLRRLPKVTAIFDSNDDEWLTANIAATLRRSVTALENNLNDQLKIAREENNILWWIIGECSNDLNQRFADLPIGTACLLAGQEVADLCIPPGPVAVRAFLDRVLRTAHPQFSPTKSLLSDALASTPDEWLRQRLIKPLIPPSMVPVHNSFATRSAQISIEDPVALAYQTFLEAQLLRIVDQ